jgi:hypothetical protein
MATTPALSLETHQMRITEVPAVLVVLGLVMLLTQQMEVLVEQDIR